MSLVLGEVPACAAVAMEICLAGMCGLLRVDFAVYADRYDGQQVRACVRACVSKCERESSATHSP